MQRDLRLLEAHEFDVLVIGSGIYGACLAREAAMRGLRVALIDKGDFGASTSANSLKVVHGGLRYLQHLNWVRMRESIRARRQFLTMAPYLVKPRQFLMPTYGCGMQSRWIMRIALLINDILSADRNQSLKKDVKIPSGKVLSRTKLLDQVPELSGSNATGAAQWCDGYIEDTDRMMMALVHSVSEMNAVVANYVCAHGYVQEGGQVKGIDAEDTMSGRRFRIHAKTVLNTAGPGAENLNSALPDEGGQSPSGWVKAVNVFIKRPLFRVAIGLASTTEHVDKDAVINKGNRLYFFVPWKTGTLVGTEYVAANVDDDSTSIDDYKLSEILDEINSLYPGASVGRDDVGFCHVGLLPAKNADVSADAAARLLKHTAFIDHGSASGIAGLYTVSGIKYTVAPQVAITVMDKILSSMHVHAPRPVKEPVLYGATSAGEELLDAEEQRLTSRYGSRCEDVLGIAQESPEFSAVLGEDTDTIGAEVVHSVRMEMALTLSDVVYRRTGLGDAGIPSQRTLERAADLMSQELDWDDVRIDDEIRTASEAGPYCRK